MPSRVENNYLEGMLKIEVQMNSILSRYIKGPRRGAGLRDALDYASLRLEEWGLYDPSTRPEVQDPLWAFAEREAERRGGDPGVLKELLKMEGTVILKHVVVPGGALGQMGQALLNLSESF
jgi:hypothetical protein